MPSWTLDDADLLKAELWRGYLADGSLNADERGAIRMLSLAQFPGLCGRPPGRKRLRDIDGPGAGRRDTGRIEHQAV